MSSDHKTMLGKLNSIVCNEVFPARIDAGQDILVISSFPKFFFIFSYSQNAQLDVDFQMEVTKPQTPQHSGR